MWKRSITALRAATISFLSTTPRLSNSTTNAISNNNNAFAVFSKAMMANTRLYSAHKKNRDYEKNKASKIPKEDKLKVFNDVNTISLKTLRDNPGATKERMRVGRGIGSGKGKTSGRGHKGQKARKTNDIPKGFDGGQTTLYRKVPKYGFSNKKFALEYQPVSLGRIQYLIDTGRIDTNGTITMKTLIDSGAVTSIKFPGVKLLADGKEFFKAKVDIEVPRASKEAIAAVEAAGGSIRCVYYNKLGIHALLHPEKYITIPKRAMPPPKLWRWYSRSDVRGYLANDDPLADVVPPEEFYKLKPKQVQV